jgi:hypothetical protein
VQPYYVIIPQECTGKEIDTIHDIQRQIFRDNPDTRDLIMPIIYIDERAIFKDEEITNEYNRIAKLKNITSQYETLARYCKQIGAKNMELSVLNRERFDYFRTNTTIFQYFGFPLLGFTKSGMADIAEQNGWTKYMLLTRFCRRPKGNRPCGYCGPCTDVVIAGMAWRLPMRSRVIAYLQLPFRKWWRNNYLKQDTGIYRNIKKILIGRC